MAEPLKRTNLRSSPEDAAFYRKYHDHALSTLRKGTPREQLLKDLVDKGVPEKTSERIVIAVEQELALKTAKSAAPRRVGMVIGFIVVVWGSVAGYIVWQMTKDGTFHWQYLVAAGVIALILTARVLGRLLLRQRDVTDLPPPPSPGPR